MSPLDEQPIGETSIAGLTPQQTRWMEILFLLLVVALAYGGTLQFKFIYDDHLQIEQNESLKQWSSVSMYFTGNLWQHAGSHSLYYRPVFGAFWILLYHLFGTATWGWHLGSVVLHAIASVLVLLLARKLLKNEAAAWLATLLFALHPVHIETVSWVSASCDLLMTVFALATLICHVNFSQATDFQWRWKFASYFFFLLAMGSKEPGITVLAMVGIYDWMTTEVPPTVSSIPYKLRRILPSMVPWVVLGAGYLYMRHMTVGAYTTVGMPNSVVAMTWPWLLWFYVKKFIWPVESSEFYDAEYVDTFSWQLFWVPVIGLLLVAALCWFFYNKKRDHRIPVFLCWIALPIVPQWDLRVFSRNDFAHDRYLYLPSIGFCLLLGLVWSSLAEWMESRKINPQKSLIVTTISLVLVFVPLTFIESSNWADDILLYTHATKVAPKYNAVPLTNLGDTLLKRNQLEDALHIYELVEKVSPEWWTAKYNTGIALFDLQRYSEADQKFYEALMLPKVAPQEPLLYMGQARMKMGRWGDAEPVLRRANDIAESMNDPDRMKYKVQLALCLEQLGQKDRVKAEESLKILQEIQVERPVDSSIAHEIENVQRLLAQPTTRRGKKNQ